MNPNKKVLLVEYGPKGILKNNDLDNSIQNKNKINHHDPYECTNKGLGGTSATWGGRCVMYDEVDFVNRPIIGDNCTWDQDLFQEVKSYLKSSAEYFECGEPIFNSNELIKEKRIAENFSEGDVTDSVLERWSMPTRFGQRYKKEIAERNNLTILFGFEARDFLKSKKDNSLSFLKVRNLYNKGTMEVRAKAFVLCAGAQESTRILLRNKQIFESIGGPPCSLGKYYQGHLSGKIASVRFNGDPRRTDFSFIKDSDGIYVRRRFQFNKDYLVKENLLNTAIWLDNPLYFDPKHKSGAMSFMYLAMLMPFIGKRLAPPAIAHSITKGKVQDVSKHVINIIKGFPGSLLKPASIFYKRYCLKRKLPGVFLYSPQNCYALHFHAEQIPTDENRMELAEDNETLVIHYSLTNDDIESVIRLHEKLDKHLRSNNCGKLEYWYPPAELKAAIKNMSKDGIHQCGTTRIANSSDKGVVDRSLKVWGTENLYVCSSSVFPTSGQANPTFLLGAFAVRLAHHLSK
ncbi:GMC family oxidoreductase [Flavisolibacter ginsengisoli]|uniref:GMC family oxidoreductase n=1 Tax=Flavisolibacter ginsengisoli TaxID=462367 RepID=UPI001C315F7A|nr:GMC oxidoreductase [Flavisolibacter ginsengisoli]